MIEHYSDTFAFLSGPKAMVEFTSDDDATKHSKVNPDDMTSTPWVPWGSDNLEPQDIMEDLKRTAIPLPALMLRRNVHFGRGIIAYRDKEDQEGVIKKEIAKDQDVVEFFTRNKINRQWIKGIGALELFANCFPEFVLNKIGTRINSIKYLDPAYCRYEVMNDRSLRIENIYYSAKWPTPSAGYYTKIPTFNPEKFKKGEPYPDKKFIYPIFLEDSWGESYYKTAIWLGVRESGWLRIMNKIPTLKLAMMKNQMIIKYHIQIPDRYFYEQYPDPDYTKQQRDDKKKEVLDNLNSFLSDVENSGKSFVSFFNYDPVTQREAPGWKIEVIDNKLKDDAYLPDSQAANSEFLAAAGIDPTLLGQSGVPGGKLGAGSGSDKREAYWMLNANLGVNREISLEPLYFIRDFNGWDPEIKFAYLTVDTSQTQDKHPTKTEKRIDGNANQ